MGQASLASGLSCRTSCGYAYRGICLGDEDPGAILQGPRGCHPPQNSQPAPAWRNVCLRYPTGSGDRSTQCLAPSFLPEERGAGSRPQGRLPGFLSSRGIPRKAGASGSIVFCKRSTQQRTNWKPTRGAYKRSLRPVPALWMNGSPTRPTPPWDGGTRRTGGPRDRKGQSPCKNCPWKRRFRRG